MAIYVCTVYVYVSKSYIFRVSAFDEVFQDTVLNFNEIKKLCFRGIPEGEGRRAMAWRILLNYLPMEKSLWKDSLHNKRQLYQEYLAEMILCSTSSSAQTDHPLNPNPESQWQSFFKDNEVLLQIDKDVRRLCPDISFFSQPTSHPNRQVVHGQFDRLHQRVQQTRLSSQNIERKGLGMAKLTLSKKKAPESYAPLELGAEAHWEVVERILFLYAKLNPGQSYVQGMNEIIGPIYYVFASDPREEWRAHAEADCFFCFTNLMSDIRDFFIKTLDESECGINQIMHKFMAKLKRVDSSVYQTIQKQEIKPQFFAFRWLSLMLSQEFALPDVLRIWDSLLSDDTRRNFLIDVCVAMVVLVREEIMSHEFPENMKLLQNYPINDVQVILHKAASVSISDATYS